MLDRISHLVVSFLLLLSVVKGQEPNDQFVKSRQFETNALHITMTNDGRLWAPKLSYNGIHFRDNTPYLSVFDHGLVILGYRDGQLVGTAPFWSVNYTPGPIIQGRAAFIAAPQDSSKYRTYIITKNSKPGDKDYDEWPVQWGAPVTPDGNPKLHGDVTAWTVYNDAHPEVHSFIEMDAEELTNTDVEIHETIWGYDRANLLGQSLFFKWQIYNKGSTTLDSLIVAHWNDIDLFASQDYPYFSREHGFGYIFSPAKVVGHIASAAAYILLQGPLKKSVGGEGYAFEHIWEDHCNLPVTAFWGILDDSYTRKNIGSLPENLQQLYYYCTGRRHDGSPLRNPETGEAVSYTFTGDPITQSGWSQHGSGGCGGISASGPITLAAGDSVEIIYALIFASSQSNELTWNLLLGNSVQIRDFFVKGIDIPDIPEETPVAFALRRNYPNPFNGETFIQYDVPQTAQVSIKIYNLRGEYIAELYQGERDAGTFDVSFRPRASLASGIYIIRLSTPYGTLSKKMTLLR